MRILTLRDEDFVGGIYQITNHGSEQLVRVLIANTDNIDTSTTPDNVVLLKLPPAPKFGGTTITVELLTDLSATLRIVGATPSQGVGHAIVKKNVETTTRGDTITLVANRDRAWEIVTFGNAKEGDGSFGGTFTDLSIDHAEVYADGVRVDGDTGDGDGADGPVDILVADGQTVQLTPTFYDGDENALNGVPAVWADPDDPSEYGIAVTSDGRVTAQEPAPGSAAGTEVFLYSAEDLGSEKTAIYALSLVGLATAALVALARALHAGSKIGFYDGADPASATLLAESTLAPGFVSSMDDTFARPSIRRRGDDNLLSVEQPVVTFVGTVKSVRVTDSRGNTYDAAVADATAGTEGLGARVLFTDTGTGPEIDAVTLTPLGE